MPDSPLFLLNFSLNFDFFDFFLFLYFISCIRYKLPIITLMKAVSTDGHYDLLAACPMFNIEMYCDVDYWANKMLTFSSVAHMSPFH